MKWLNFKTSLLFAPLAYAIHHAEENLILNFRAWRLQYFSDNNPLTTEAVFVILTAITLIYLILHSLYENKTSANLVILFLMGSQVANVIFHAGGTVIFWHYSPGLITGLLLYVPVNIVILVKAYQEHWVTKRSLIVLLIAGNIVFWIFEIFGPLPVLILTIITFGWIIVTGTKQNLAGSEKQLTE
ncbi:MAG: HXXEE domain-containing protein [Chloroflexota bacterium]